jgi:hypothetical protein
MRSLRGQAPPSAASFCFSTSFSSSGWRRGPSVRPTCALSRPSPGLPASDTVSFFGLAPAFCSRTWRAACCSSLRPPATAATCASGGSEATLAAALIEIVPLRTASTSSGAGRLLDALDLADGIRRHARGLRDFLARAPGRRTDRPCSCVGLPAHRSRTRRLCWRHARGHDFLLAQGQHAALEVGHAAARQMVVDHPQHDVFDANRSLSLLDGAERDAVLRADVVAVMAVDQHVAPQHERVAATFGQQAAFERGVFDGCEGIDERAEFLVDRDIQSVSLRAACVDATGRPAPGAASAAYPGGRGGGAGQAVRGGPAAGCGAGTDPIAMVGAMMVSLNAWCPEPGSNRHAISGTGF